VKPKPNSSSPSPSFSSALRDPDHFLVESAGAARLQLDRCITDAAKYARTQPEKALGSALLAGYVLRMLPVFGLLRFLTGLILALLKPVLVVYAVAKLWQKVAPAAPANPGPPSPDDPQ
jgi:hypothetical protein